MGLKFEPSADRSTQTEGLSVPRDESAFAIL